MGLCTNACEMDRDCAPGAMCRAIDGLITVCVEPPRDRCIRNSDCDRPLVCGRDRTCRNECRADVDCRDGRVCSAPDARGIRACVDGSIADGGIDGAPPPDGGPATGDVRAAAGERFSCAWTAAGVPYCFGNNDVGQLGDGTATASLLPIAVSALSSVDLMSTGHDFGCSLKAGAVECWGQGTRGQLGDGSTTSRSMPAIVPGLPAVVHLSAGNRHVCVADATGGVWCWGDDNAGQLGDGSAGAPSAMPVSATAAGFDEVVEVAGGGNHSCARTVTRAVWCWGANIAGQLGDGTTTPRARPVMVIGLTDAMMIGAGDSHSCALTLNGLVRCWGFNATGELGDKTTMNSSVPTMVTALDQVTAISVGAAHACAVRATGDVLCWGANMSGQLGNGTILPARSPVSAAIGPSLDVECGVAHTFARTLAGELYCWGANVDGQCGSGGMPPIEFMPVMTAPLP